MYSRPAKYRNISIPENYSGNAFGNGLGNGTDDINGKLSGGGGLSEVESSTWEPAEDLPEVPLPAEKPPSEEKEHTKDSLFPSLLAGKFPFGHGIGTEELIIIGVMLVILRSPDEKPDSDMLLILALLLFAG